MVEKDTQPNNTAAADAATNYNNNYRTNNNVAFAYRIMCLSDTTGRNPQLPVLWNPPANLRACKLEVPLVCLDCAICPPVCECVN